LIGDGDLLRWRWWTVAGGGIQLRAVPVIDEDAILGFLGQTKTMRRCAWESGRERGRRGATECPDHTGIQSSSSL
jgi:hypothetical protein